MKPFVRSRVHRTLSVVRWGLLWHQVNRLDGLNEHIMFRDGLPVLFCTRREARQWATKEYGYIKTRSDLRNEPHCWRVPQPVRVTVTANAPEQARAGSASPGSAGSASESKRRKG